MVWGRTIRERRDQIATLEFNRDEFQQLLATPQQKLTRDQVMVLLTRLHTVLETGKF